MNYDVEITDFKNFSQFLKYNEQHIEEMASWSVEKSKEYCDKVVALQESSPEFKKQYDDWAKALEKKAKIYEMKEKCKVTIGGNAEDMARAKAYLKLREIQKKRLAIKKSKEAKSAEGKEAKSAEGKSQPDIVIVKCKKKQYTI